MWLCRHWRLLQCWVLWAGLLQLASSPALPLRPLPTCRSSNLRTQIQTSATPLECMFRSPEDFSGSKGIPVGICSVPSRFIFLQGIRVRIRNLDSLACAFISAMESSGSLVYFICCPTLQVHGLRVICALPTSELLWRDPTVELAHNTGRHTRGSHQAPLDYCQPCLHYFLASVCLG